MRRPAAKVVLRKPAAKLPVKKSPKLNKELERPGILKKSRGGKSPKEAEIENPFLPFDSGAIWIGSQLRLKGTYCNNPVEVVGEITARFEDSSGNYLKLQVCGSPHLHVQEYVHGAIRAGLAGELFIQEGVMKVPARGPEFFHPVLMKEPGRNLVVGSSPTPGEGDLGQLHQAAEAMGFSQNPMPQAPPSAPRLGAGQPDPLQDRDGGSVSSGESSGVKKKKKKRKKKKRKRSGGPHRRTKERIKEMLVRSRWNWKGSSIDPMFRVKRDHGGSSSRGSNSSSSEDSAESGGLFQEPSQVRRISQKCPGLLTRHGMSEANKFLRRFLLGGDEVRPVMMKYFRQQVVQSGAMPSKPMRREFQTLATCLDSLVEGNVLGATDICMQRMKSLELMAQGGSPETAMKVEVLLPDTARLLSAGEGHNAAQEQRTSERLETQLRGSAGGNRWMSRWEPPKGDRKGDGKGEGKKGEGKDKGKRWEGGKPAAQTQAVAPS